MTLVGLRSLRRRSSINLGVAAFGSTRVSLGTTRIPSGVDRSPSGAALGPIQGRYGVDPGWIWSRPPNIQTPRWVVPRLGPCRARQWHDHAPDAEAEPDDVGDDFRTRTPTGEAKRHTCLMGTATESSSMDASAKTSRRLRRAAPWGFSSCCFRPPPPERERERERPCCANGRDGGVLSHTHTHNGQLMIVEAGAFEEQRVPQVGRH